jgi:hypothetical protein
MKFIYYCVFILLISSCNNKKTAAIQEIEKPESSRVKKHDQLASIQSRFQLDIDTWKEYEDLAIFLQQYNSISPNNALNNSRELNDITKSLNDSIKPQFLETPAFKARINLLFNETLRLYDMSSIPAIKPVEVNNQVAKVLHAFSSINSKINTILKQRDLEEDVIDVNFKRETPENLKIDSDIPKFEILKKKRGSKKIRKKDSESKFFKRPQKMILLEEELSKEKRNSAKKLKKDAKKNNN